MNKDVNRRDWEAISAYLDDQLKPRERARLEARMRGDPNLEAAMESMSRTRTLLRRMPPIRAPRNFTLSPEMVGHRSPAQRLFPAMRLATALATLLLVLVVAGDLSGLFGGPLAMPALERMAGTPVAMQEAQQAPAEATAEVAVTLEVEAAAPESVVGDEGETLLQQEPSDLLRVEPQATASEKSVGEIVPEQDEVAEQAVEEVAEAPLVGEPAEGEAPAETLPPAYPVEDVELIPATEVPPTPAPAPTFFAPSPSPGLAPIRRVEIGLALIAVSSALIALFLRSRAG